MKRKIAVEVEKRSEAKSIEWALTDPAFRATAIIVGTLMPYTKRQQTRMMQFIADKIYEEQEKP